MDHSQVNIVPVSLSQSYPSPQLPVCQLPVSQGKLALRWLAW
jgi:hypothetical protein